MDDTLGGARRRGGGLAFVALIALAAALFALIALAACDTAAPEPTPTPVNPAALLAESGDAMNALQSFRFRLAHNKSARRSRTDSRYPTPRARSSARIESRLNSPALSALSACGRVSSPSARTAI